MLIHKRILAALLKPLKYAAADGDPRYAFRFAKITESGNYAESSNGDYLVAVRNLAPACSEEYPGAVDSQLESALLDSDSVQAIKASIPKKTPRPILENASLTRDGNRYLARAGDLESWRVTDAHVPDVSFPNTARLWDDLAKRKPKITLGLSARYLKLLAESVLDSISPSGREPTISLTVYSEYHAVRLHAEDADIAWDALLMPVRLDSLPAGVPYRADCKAMAQRSA